MTGTRLSAELMTIRKQLARRAGRVK